MSEETGEQFPALTERPELTLFDEYYLKAFFRLSSSRNSGMAIGPIPLSEILNYCEFIEDDDPETFIDIMQHCDSVYLAMEYEKHKDNGKK